MVNIEVLCTNGHRVRVTANPNTTLLQVLTEACNRKSIGPVEEFGLKHNGKTLDLSLPLRYTTLTNNAKVEMCHTGSVQNASVTIALQVDSGPRKQIDSTPNLSLANMLSKFAETFPEMADQVSQESHRNLTPVVVYLREEIPGWFCLQNTSLKSLGITRGRVAFRLVWRQNIESQVAKAEEELRSRTKTESQPSKPTAEASQSTDESQTPPVVFGAPAFASGSADGPQRGFSWFNDPPTPKPPKQVPVVSAFDVNPFARALQQVQAPVQNLSEFKFPDETAGQNLYQNELSEAKIEDYQPCDRQTVWYKLGGIGSSSKIDTEVPDSFFDVTESDLRMMMADLKRQVNTEAEAPLMTTSMRMAAKDAKYDKYKRAIIRFVFPDASVLQAVFRPRETIHALYKFMDKELKGEMSTYHLYTSPPKMILKNREKTLIEADLVPLSRIYVGSGSNQGENVDFRLPDVSFSSPRDAYNIVLDVMNSMPSKNKGQDSLDRNEEKPTSSRPSQSTPSNDAASKKVPKWFKTGK